MYNSLMHAATTTWMVSLSLLSSSSLLLIIYESRGFDSPQGHQLLLHLSVVSEWVVLEA
jgi:hypothetical protein